MSKHRKFELEELPKAAVVNSSVYAANEEVDQLINEAVTDHISKIIESDTDKNEGVKEGLVAEESEIFQSPESQIVNSPAVDIEKIRQEAYNQALEESKAKYEPQLADLVKKKDFSELLQQKLSSIVPEEEIDSQIAKVSAESISGIARKLHLILPVNFEEIIRKGLIEKLNNFYKEGNITLTVHPNQYAFCTDVLQSEAIPSKFKGNFQIEKDDSIGVDDCKLEWADTKLEYNQEQLASEIDKIIEQLKSAT